MTDKEKLRNPDVQHSDLAKQTLPWHCPNQELKCLHPHPPPITSFSLPPVSTHLIFGVISWLFITLPIVSAHLGCWDKVSQMVALTNSRSLLLTEACHQRSRYHQHGGGSSSQAADFSLYPHWVGGLKKLDEDTLMRTLIPS